MKIIWLTLLLLSLGLPVVAADEEERGKIVYANEGDIYVMDADGRNPVQLTTHPDLDFDPSWSPDGTQIAFRSHRDGNEEVYIMDADGSHQRNFTNHPASDHSPAWSPDGMQIAFSSNRDGDPNEIYLMDADGSNPKRLTDFPGIDEYPGWSPDGSRIAFHCTAGERLPSGVGDFEICVINVDGTGLTQLTNTPGENKLPAWSPDGRLIAFQSNRDGWPADYTPPAYDGERFGEYDLYVMQVDGSEQINLTQNPRQDEEFAAWSPDGRLIFSRYGCLVVLDMESGEEIQLSKGRCAGKDSGFFADWWAGE